MTNLTHYYKLRPADVIKAKKIGSNILDHYIAYLGYWDGDYISQMIYTMVFGYTITMKLPSYYTFFNQLQLGDLGVMNGKETKQLIGRLERKEGVIISLHIIAST